MAGIQLSGLLSSSKFDWKSVVDQLIAVERTPINRLNQEKADNSRKVTALDGLKTTLTSLQTATQALRADTLFSGRTVTSDLTNTTWTAIGTTAAPLGAYTFDVTQLATPAKILGTADIAAGLNPTNDVSGLTIANLTTATAVTAGTFTVNGQQVTVATTDSLAAVFSAIATATGNDVTASYDSVLDKVTLVDGTGELVIGASNDTSNFLQVMKLANNGIGTVASSGALGTVKTATALASAGLRTAVTAVDGSGNGTFAINGVSIAYNVNTDTLTSVISRINASTASVTASYDGVSDRMVLTNKKTGDIGLSVSESAGGLLGALGVSGAALVHGDNAEFTVNGGATLTSTSNNLDAAAHGITGLNVTVNTETEQTINVASDTSSMQTAVESFISKFNEVQGYIEDYSAITSDGTTVSTSILTDNREVQTWATRLRTLAFDSLTGITSSFTRLDHLGIDFNAAGDLAIKDSAKLANALASSPDEVAAFFQSGTSGFVSKVDTYLTAIIAEDATQQTNLGKASTRLDEQIAVLERRIASERERLTAAFIGMEEAQALANSQEKTLNSAFFQNQSN